MATLDSHRLAEEFQKTAPKDVRADCPPAERIWAAVMGELAPQAVRETVDHTALCMDCSIAWRVALDVSREDEESQVRVVPLLPLRSRLARSLVLPGGLGLLAAAVAIALLRGPALVPDRTGRVDVERGAKHPLTSLVPPGTQPRNNIVLRWSPYPGAERYSVTVTGPSLDVLYRTFGLSTTEVRLPPEALAGQPSPAHLLWSVEATLPGGRVVESEVFKLDAD